METAVVNGASEPPLLMISHGESLEKHLTYNLSEKRFRKLNIPELSGKKVLSSIYGWLVLVEPLDSDDGDGHCCLFNPTSKDKIELPKLNDSINYNQCILTRPPTEPDCYILFNGLEQSFCRIGDKEYVTRTLEQQEEEEQENGRVGFDKLYTIGSFEGKTYGFMHPDKFVTIHFVGNTIEFRQKPMGEPWVIPHSSSSYDIWLIEPAQSDGGELLMVQKIFVEDASSGVLYFLVFRIDTNQMKCSEVNNIGNRTIFVCREGIGYCCPCSGGVKPNSIYYTDEDDRNLHIFDLEDKSISSMLPSSAVSANKSIMTCWIEHQLIL